MATKKSIHSYIKENDLSSNHALLDEVSDQASETIVNRSTTSPQDNEGVWPADNLIIIDRAIYENDKLKITLLNNDSKNIDLISWGVKYGSDLSESIDFKETNAVLKPGENTVEIPCPKGKPFKFVIRTNRKTGAGSTREDLNW
ncbi:MAG: hypothetical protein ABIC91_01520 [Nanoarchaeota archaeon]|nr:hypothetical protein [Nanoarchaeota archaeon]MBU1031101.1 hypothetical protein [Nanoarchaeota archaeon]MBU1849543.1 hypothetical protein [Nanoarchaeota archaeon]